MKAKKTILSVVACAIALVMSTALFAACGPKTPKDEDPTITKIEIASMAEVATGDTKNVIELITYSDGSTKKYDSAITWNTSNAEVATVARGVVTGKAKGTANITATVGEGDKAVISNVCAVSVYALTVELTAEDLEAGATTAKLNKEETLQLNATAYKDGTAMDDVEFEWSTSDENVATVSQTGLVTGWDDGEATITATRKGGSQKAEFTVTVEWEKPVGYKPMEFAEQNKLHPGAWGYWNAQSGWGQGIAAANAQYTSEFVESEGNLKDGYEYIGMGKATFEFTVSEYFASHTYQIFYRSSDNFTDDEGVQGKLHFNHDYEITLKVMSNVAGLIHVNPYDDIRKKKDDETVEDYNAYLVAQETAGKIKLAKDADGEYKTNEDGVYVTDHDFVLEANKETEITVIFRHDDCGYIYQTTIYDNMGTALHIQLADLGWDKEAGESRGRTVFSVYDVQFKDLGEADNPVECDETKHDGYVDPNAPVIPTPSAAMSLDDSPKATKAYLEASEDGTKAYFVIEGTVDLSKFDNDAEKAQAWLYAAYMDLQIAGGGWNLAQFGREATVNAENSTFVIKYDITNLAVSTGNGSGAYSGHFTDKESTEEGYGNNTHRDLKLDTEHAVPDQTITVGNKKFTIVNHYGSGEQNDNYGCVSVKVESVEAAE